MASKSDLELSTAEFTPSISRQTLPAKLENCINNLSADKFTKSPWINRNGCSDGLQNDTKRIDFTPGNISTSLTLSASRVSCTDTALEEDCQKLDCTSEDEVLEQVILSICWAHENLGAAFLDVNTRQVYIMEDKLESAPDFFILHTLMRELKPRVLIVGGRQDSRLFSVLQVLCDGTNEDSSTTEKKAKKSNENVQERNSKNASKSTDSETIEGQKASPDKDSSFSSASCTSSTSLYLLPASDFKYESCRRRVFMYPWPGVKESGENEKLSWIRSRVNLEAVALIRSMGGLLKFIEQKGSEYLFDDAILCSTPVLGLHTYIMEDLLYMDEATMLGLQVFSEDLHPAASKNGKYSASKEGLSLYAILNRTASPLSSKLLRLVLHRPIRDPKVLISRYNFLQWALQPINFDTVKSLQALLRNISGIQMLFSRLQRSQLNVRDWKNLYKSIFNAVLFAEICEAQDQSIHAFKEVCECSSEGLYHATYLIQRTLDFDQADREGRFVVKPGLDIDLDDKKRRFHSLGDMMHKVAEIELANLPSNIESCCVIYLPHVGYLLAIPPSDVLNSYSRSTEIDSSNDNSSLNGELQYDIPGLQFRFSTADMVLFKSQLCEELDNVVGDLQVDIANRETSIMIRLIEEILQHSHFFLSLVNKAMMVDVLLSFSLVSRDFGWVQPAINAENSFSIERGRHPIYELCNPTFVSNDSVGNKKKESVILITGPNSSGKTVYIRQVGVIVYLAHLGCFVPAEILSITPLDSIFIVTNSTPSVTSGLSSFMVELNRLAIAVSRSTSKSLVLLDEFGVSTCEHDGASLLAAAINFWISQNELSKISKPLGDKKGCPFVFVSTHFHHIFDNLHPQYKFRVKCMCMETIQTENRIIPLYQVVEGNSEKSYAIQVAQLKGLPAQTIERAMQIGESLKSNCLPPRWNLMETDKENKRCREIASLFLNHNIQSNSVHLLLSSIKQSLNDSNLDSTSDISLLFNSTEHSSTSKNSNANNNSEAGVVAPSKCA